MSAIGEDLRQRRKAKGLTQGKLARLAEIDSPRLSDLETGKTQDPRASTLEKLYRALGVTLPWDEKLTDESQGPFLFSPLEVAA